MYIENLDQLTQFVALYDECPSILGNVYVDVASILAGRWRRKSNLASRPQQPTHTHTLSHFSLRPIFVRQCEGARVFGSTGLFRRDDNTRFHLCAPAGWSHFATPILSRPPWFACSPSDNSQHSAAGDWLDMWRACCGLERWSRVLFIFLLGYMANQRRTGDLLC